MNGGDRPANTVKAPTGPSNKVRGGGGISSRGTLANGRGGRQPSPARTQGDDGAGQQTYTGLTAHRGSSHSLKPPPTQNRPRNKTWRNPASLNAAFQSHAGRITDSNTARWRTPPYDDSRTYQKQMTELFQTVRLPLPPSTDPETTIVTSDPRLSL